jgi:hypothetical protein
VIAMPGHQDQQAAGGAASATAGSAQLSALPFTTGTTAAASPDAAPVTVSGPGALTVSAVPAANKYGSTAVAATGAMAQGFEAEVATDQGMGTVSCAHPGSDMWFIGTGTASGAPVTRLFLMNAGTIAATVEVTILTDSGLQQGLNAAITVAAGGYLSENIAPFTGGSQVQALHVETSSGQVATAVWQGPASGSGGAWLPQATTPAKQLVVPGLTTASSAARLFIAVPGPVDARVAVTALTAHGRFSPFGATVQDAPSGAATSLSLTSLGTSAAALLLTSNVPVIAGIAVAGNGIGSFSAAVAPVTEQGIIAGNPATGHVTVGLLLSAPTAAASATITVIPSGASQSAQSSPQTVQVDVHHTVAITVAPPAGSHDPFAIVVTPQPGSGPLYAARVVTSSGGLSGPLLSILPVQSALTQITLAPAKDSYSAILPLPRAGCRLPAACGPMRRLPQNHQRARAAPPRIESAAAAITPKQSRPALGAMPRLPRNGRRRHLRQWRLSHGAGTSHAGSLATTSRSVPGRWPSCHESPCGRWPSWRGGHEPRGRRYSPRSGSMESGSMPRARATSSTTTSNTRSLSSSSFSTRASSGRR